MKRRCAFILCFAMLLLLLAGCGGRTTDLRIGTGNIGGTYYSYGAVMADILENDLDGITCRTKSTAGSAANLRLLNEDLLQLAIVQSDTLLDAYSGTGAFAEYGVCGGLLPRAGIEVPEADGKTGGSSLLINVSQDGK